MWAEMQEGERGKWSGLGEVAEGRSLFGSFGLSVNSAVEGKQEKSAVRKRKKIAGNTKKTEQSERNLRIWPGIDQGSEVAL
jgi:hypothetical protein